MSEDKPVDEEKGKKPDPLDDLHKGFGLLFRAAKAAVDQLPKGRVEEVVKTGVIEVGRALENVTGAIAENVFHAKKPSSRPPPQAQATAQAATADPTGEAVKEPSKEPPPDATGGPRVG